MNLHVSLFDHLHVANNTGEIIPSMRPRAQRLLAYLLVHRHRPLRREHAAFSLWPDHPEHQALGMLRRALSDLRATLRKPEHGEWIIVSNREVCWALDAPYWLDVEAFEGLIHQATPAALHEAIELYSGDLLAAWDDDWVVIERERLRQLEINALCQLVAHHRALGDYDTALALARQALIHDPLAEAVYRNLIELHYEAGDRAAALATYDELSSLLRVELGVEPMAETKTVRAAIMQGDPLPSTAVLTSNSRIPIRVQSTLPRLIGRDDEMARLRALWDSAARGNGRMVTVSGDAGVGKSHLVLQLADEVTRCGGLALVGHCHEFEQPLPYQAIIEMLRSATNLLRSTDLELAHRAVLAHIAPDILGAASRPTSWTHSAAPDMRVQLFEAFLQAFLALARSQPVLLLIEDVHWAPESTLDWLVYIAPRLDASHVLVAITYRTDEVGAEHAVARLGHRLAREAAVAPLSLTSLSHEAHQELVIHISGLRNEAAESVANRLFRETAGNPFFLREIVRGLIEAGAITSNNGLWEGAFVDAAPDAEVPLPASIKEMMQARIARLSLTSRMFIQTAAVAGRIFQYEIVQRAAGWAHDLALEALDDVIARGFVRPRDSQEDFAFSHHLMQEAIYASLTAPRRRHLHHCVADAIQTLRPDNVESLAYHFARAGEYTLAIEYARQAARRAEIVYAYDEAIRHLRTALDLIKIEAHPELRVAVLEQLADSFRLKREVTDAISLYQAALELWSSIGVPDHERAVRLERKILQVLPDVREGAGFERFESAAKIGATSRKNLEAGLRREVGELSRAEVVRVLATLSTDAWKTRFPTDVEAAERYARAAVNLAERLDAPVELSAALDTLANVYGLREMFREQVQLTLRQLELARDPDFSDRHEHVTILLNAGKALARVGEYVQAMPYLHEAERLSGHIGAINRTYQALEEQARCWFRLDRWDDLFAVEKQWRDLQRRYDQERTGPLCFAIALSASVRALRGELAQAQALREEARDIMISVAGPPERWKRSHHY